MGNLEIPYRVVNIAAGDLGGAAAKKYDIEGWLPGQDRYRELTSCSNYTDYRARRLKTRVRRADGGVETLHTLNGTATAIGTDAHRDHGEPPAGGRIGRASRGAAPVPARDDPGASPPRLSPPAAPPSTPQRLVGLAVGEHRDDLVPEGRSVERASAPGPTGR